MPGSIPIAALGIQSLAMGGGVAFDEMIGHVHLGAGGVKELPPALQCSREALGGHCDDFLYIIQGEPVAVLQFVVELIDDPRGALLGVVLNGGIVQAVLIMRFQRLARLVEIQ